MNNSTSKTLAFKQFLESADVDSRKVYVNVIVCADESGTHDETGVQPGASVAIVAGIAAFGHSWTKFSRDWQATLEKYNVPYFHFREFVDKRTQSKNPKWHYYGWSEQKRHDYLVELATVLLGPGTFGKRSRELIQNARKEMLSDTIFWLRLFYSIGCRNV